MKFYYNILLLIGIILGIFLAYSIFFKQIKEGATANPGPDTINSPGTTAISVPVTSDSGLTASLNLNRIANAVAAAFAPTPPAAAPAGALPDYQTLAKNTVQKSFFSQDKCKPVQQPVEELPIDTQIQKLISTHVTTMNSRLDAYSQNLDSIIQALSNPKSILQLNPNIKYSVSTGLPVATITNDACGNNILNLTVVQGDPGKQGNSGSPGLPGIGIQGKYGGKGENGTNPFANVSFNLLPKWYKQ